MNPKTILTILAALACILPASADLAMPVAGMGGLSVTAAVKPNPPRPGNNVLDLFVTDAAGKPVTGLKLTTTVAMTSMDMGTTTPAFKDVGSGHYTVTVVFGMAGPWRVIVLGPTGKLAMLNFQAGSKTPWKSPPLKTPPAAIPAAPVIPAAPPQAPPSAAMPGMDMSSAMPGMKMDGSAPEKPADTVSSPANNDMGGMNMGGMKTAVVPQLQEKGTYTATGDENWEMQTGFGHNAGMVGMMNQMMVGGSGMEGMKMPAMEMDFGPKNYAKPDAGAAESSMAGMEMPGTKSALKITATMPSAAKTGENALHIAVMDDAGKPVTGAKITTSVAMTSMDMGTTHPAVTEAGNGKYTSAVVFGMAGPWRVTMTVAAPSQKPQTASFDFSAK